MKCCLKCYGIFKNDYFYDTCPNLTCNNPIIDIDELIQPIIFQLNQKGYKTQYCCSGHMYEITNSTYISFIPASGAMYNKIFKTIIPEGFDYENTDEFNRIFIGKPIMSKPNTINRTKEIYDNIIKLYEWVDRLPQYDFTVKDWDETVKHLINQSKINEFNYNKIRSIL